MSLTLTQYYYYISINDITDTQITRIIKIIYGVRCTKGCDIHK